MCMRVVKKRACTRTEGKVQRLLGGIKSEDRVVVKRKGLQVSLFIGPALTADINQGCAGPRLLGTIVLREEGRGCKP